MISKFGYIEVLKHVVLIIAAVVVILPFYVMASYSLKSPSEIEANRGGFFGTQEVMQDSQCVSLKGDIAECYMRPVVFNYTSAFKKAPLLRYLFNGDRKSVV